LWRPCIHALPARQDAPRPAEENTRRRNFRHGRVWRLGEETTARQAIEGRERFDFPRSFVVKGFLLASEVLFSPG